jgi:hypothetical protein
MNVKPYMITGILASLALLPACGDKSSKKSGAAPINNPLNPANAQDLALMQAYGAYLPVEATDDGKSVRWIEGKSAELEGSCQNKAAQGKSVKLSLYANASFNLYLDGEDASSFRKDEGTYSFDRQSGELHLANQFATVMSCSKSSGYLNCKTMSESMLSFFQNCDEIHFVNTTPTFHPGRTSSTDEPETKPEQPRPEGPIIVIGDDSKVPQGFERGTVTEAWEGTCKLDLGRNENITSILMLSAAGTASIAVEADVHGKSEDFVYYQEKDQGAGILLHNAFGEAMSCQRLKTAGKSSIRCVRGKKIIPILSCEFTDKK